MKVLVLGSNGMLGHVVALYLMKKGYEVIGLARKDNPFFKTMICDVRDKRLLTEKVVNGNFDYIVNCLALLVKDSEDNKADSIYVNSYLPHYIAKIIEPINTKLIQISTDSVFSGKDDKDYVVNDKKDSTRFYDMTKSLGEINDSKNLTIRASVIGIECKKDGNSLLNWFLRQNDEVYGYDSVIWSGVTTVEYAKAIEKLINTNLHGIYHLSNNSGISKGNLLRLVNKHLKKKKINIISNNSIKLKRVLINNNKTFNIIVPSYEDMIIDLKNWVKENENYYRYFYGDTLDEFI